MQDALLKMWCRFEAIRHSERGATAVEYGLLVALIAAVIVATVAAIGTKVHTGFQTVDTNLP